MLTGPSKTTGPDKKIAYFSLFIDALRHGAHRAAEEERVMMLVLFPGNVVESKWAVVKWGKEVPQWGEILHLVRPNRKKRRTSDEVLLAKRK